MKIFKLSFFILISIGAFAQSPITSVAPPLNRVGNQAGLGVVPISNGGTAATTKETALNNLLPAQSNTTTQGKVLQSTGTTHSWVDATVAANNYGTKLVSANYSVLTTDELIIFNGSSNIAVTLPAPSTVLGFSFKIVWLNTTKSITFNYPVSYQYGTTFVSNYTWSPLLPGGAGNCGGNLTILSDGNQYFLIP